MKTKELIRQLQEADPTGEVECCVGNVDIHFVGIEPAYYDGSLQVLVRDESKSPYYNIVGGKYVRMGDKVVIHTLSIEDALFNAGPDDYFDIDYTQLPPDRAEATKKSHEAYREWHRNMLNDHEREDFVRWSLREALKLTEDVEDVDGIAKGFFKSNVSLNDPLPEGGVPLGMSYVSTREKQWGERFVWTNRDGFLRLELRTVTELQS